MQNNAKIKECNTMQYNIQNDAIQFLNNTLKSYAMNWKTWDKAIYASKVDRRQSQLLR